MSQSSGDKPTSTMDKIVLRKLTNPTDEQFDQGSAVLDAAFRNAPDTFSKSLVGGDQSLSLPLQRAHMAAGAIGGEVWVAGFSPTDISAVAVWFGPGQDFLGSEEQRQAGWNDVTAKFTPELQKWWEEEFLPKYNALTEAALGKDTKHKSWKLQLLGTIPDCQGKGLGAVLVNVIKDRADKEGALTCLETTNDLNIAFYQHLGFVVRGKCDIVGSHGTVTMTCLARDPDQGAA